jgi:hypothetical protein
MPGDCRGLEEQNREVAGHVDTGTRKVLGCFQAYMGESKDFLFLLK